MQWWSSRKITLEQSFLIVGQNNYGNKIPFLLLFKKIYYWKSGKPAATSLTDHTVYDMFIWLQTHLYLVLRLMYLAFENRKTTKKLFGSYLLIFLSWKKPNFIFVQNRFHFWVCLLEKKNQQITVQKLTEECQKHNWWTERNGLKSIQIISTIDILCLDEKINLYLTEEQLVLLVRNLSDLAVSSGSKLFEPFYLHS